MAETNWEQLRLDNIAKNQAILAALGLENPIPVAAPKTKTKNKAKARPKPVKATKKRKAESDGDEPVAKKTRGDENDSGDEKGAEVSSTRRSSRHANKPRVSYANDGALIKRDTYGGIKSDDADDDGDDNESDFDEVSEGEYDSDTRKEKRQKQRKVAKLTGRKHDPKTYGSIPGVPIGRVWETRAACSADAIHAPWVAGISADSRKGAYSIALSGGYDDDVDLGYAFTYTGAGGRDLKGTKQNPKNLRTAPQSCDQSFDNPMNKALKASVDTKNPIRVIRGYKLNSKWAPSEGYRYDGLYTVERAWMEKGLNPKGYLVCKYALKRVDGQEPLIERGAEPVDDDGETEAEEAEDEDEDEEGGEENE